MPYLALRKCWAISDNKKSFEQALHERGYYLAKGDRRGYVVIDIHGEVYSLTRQIGIKKKEVEARIGIASKLPSVKDVKNNIITKVSKIYNGFLLEQSKDHQKELLPLLKTKQAMTAQHRIDRTAQKTYQENRWQKEELKRVSHIRKGFKGIWDKLNGKYWKARKTNEIETRKCDERDKAEREHLIKKQLIQRQNLQVRLTQLQLKHEKDRLQLIRDLSHMAKAKGKAAPNFSKFGFNDGEGDIKTPHIAEALEFAGYYVKYSKWFMHNELIYSIKKDDIEYMPLNNPEYRIGYDDPLNYLPEDIKNLLEEEFSSKILFVSE